MKKKTIILGAGISGLSAAHFLSKKSDDFLVLEGSNRVGGNIHSEKIDGYLCENGPNTVLLNNTALLQLIQDLSLESKVCKPSKSAAHSRFVLHNNKLQKIPTNPLQFFTTPLLKFSDKLLLLKEPFVNKHKTDTSIASFSINRFGKGFYEQFILPFVTGIYAGNPEKMSIKHALKLLWDMEQKHGSVFKGFQQKRKEQKKDSLPKIKMFTLPNGLEQLTDSIAEKLGSKLHLNSKVERIEKLDSLYKVHTNKKSFECEQIICCLPASIMSTLVEDEHLSQELQSIEYVPVDVFHFGFDKKQVKNQVPGFGLLTKETDKKHFLGLLFNSRIFPHTCPEGKELFTLIVGGSRQTHLCQEDPSKLQHTLLSEVSEILETKGEPCFSKHIRYQKAIPQYGLNHQQLLDSLRNYQSNNPNFYFLSNYTNGVSVSDRVLRSQELINNL